MRMCVQIEVEGKSQLSLIESICSKVRSGNQEDKIYKNTKGRLFKRCKNGSVEFTPLSPNRSVDKIIV